MLQYVFGSKMFVVIELWEFFGILKSKFKEKRHKAKSMQSLKWKLHNIVHARR